MIFSNKTFRLLGKINVGDISYGKDNEPRSGTKRFLQGH